MRNLLIYSFLCLISIVTAFSQEIKSLKVERADDFMAPPILRQGSGDRLSVTFDIIGDSPEYLRYRISHLNADGSKSLLMDSEFLGSFNEFEIDDYAYSDNTYIHYVNYRIEIDEDAIPFKTSGDYRIEIFPEGEPDKIIAEIPFSVSENIIGVKGNVTGSTDKGFNTEYQQLSFNIDATSLGNINPYQDLVVTIEQNMDAKGKRFIKGPQRVNGNLIEYGHKPELIFEASNEYRRFETVRADYPGLHVDSVKYYDGINHAWIQPDDPRKEKRYTYDQTQNGRFKINEYNSTDPNLSADYIMVHFSLVPPDTNVREIFLQGEFTQNNLDNASLMRYDWNDGLYHADLLLKQGSYNYQYVALLDQSGQSDPAPIEGNKYETQNEYLVLVYFRPPGARADRLFSSSQFFFQP